MRLGKRELALMRLIGQRETNAKPNNPGAVIRRSQERTAAKLQARELAVCWQTTRGYRWFLTSIAEDLMEQR